MRSPEVTRDSAVLAELLKKPPVLAHQPIAFGQQGLDDLILQNVISQQDGGIAWEPARDEALLSQLIGGQENFRASDRDEAILAGLLGGQSPARATTRDEAILSDLLGERTMTSSLAANRERDAAVLSGLLGSQPQDRDSAILADLLQQREPISKREELDAAVLEKLLAQVAAPKILSSSQRDDAILGRVLSHESLGVQQQWEDDDAIQRLMSSARTANSRKSSARKLGRHPKTASQSSFPLVVAVKESMNHFLLQCAGGQVSASVVAGGNGKGSYLHQLFRPVGIALDSSGGLLIADNGNRRIVRWSLASGASCGEIVADSQGRGENSFDPLGLACTEAGDILVSVSGGVELWRYGASHGDVVAINENMAGADAERRTSWPVGIALDKTAAVFYFADMLDHCVCMMDLRGQSFLSEIVAGEYKQSQPFSCQAGSKPNQLHRPFGVAVDQGDGAIFVADSANHRVVRWEQGAAEGIVVAGGKGPGARSDQLHYPRGVAVDESGALLVADTFNHRVMRWVRGAKRGELVAGGCGQGCRVNQLSQPNCIAVDGSGALYIADTGNHRVVRWVLQR
jgi:sugar lactone lactonase YvrE